MIEAVFVGAGQPLTQHFALIQLARRKKIMTNKLALFIGTVALSTLALAGPKNYTVVLPTPTKAGSVDLAPGDYKVKVDGSNAIFTDEHTRASVTVPVKVENTETKFNATTLDTKMQGNTAQLLAIELGGSKVKLEFGK
jgi:hypothetical protein